MMRVLLASAVAVIATTSLAAANSIDARQAHQYDRIEEGRESGAITWLEGLRLRAEQRRISRLENALEDSDGHLSKSNWRALHHLQDEASDDIEAMKDNAHYRPFWLPRVGR